MEAYSVLPGFNPRRVNKPGMAAHTFGICMPSGAEAGDLGSQLAFVCRRDEVQDTEGYS